MGSSPLLRIAFLLSGRGRTLDNLCAEIDAGRVPAKVVGVASSVAGAGGLEIAARRGIPAITVSRKEAASAEAFSEALTAAVRSFDPGLVVMGGFIHHWRLPADFAGRVINVHPSLIPAFCGKGFYGDKVHQAVLAAGVRVSGCTVHFVDNLYDHGPIILQRTAPVLDDDTVHTLAARVFDAERAALPEAVRLFIAGRGLTTDN